MSKPVKTAVKAINDAIDEAIGSLNSAQTQEVLEQLGTIANERLDAFDDVEEDYSDPDATDLFDEDDDDE